MKRVSFLRLVSIAVMACLVSACSRTYQVTFEQDRAHGDTVAVERMNRRLADRGVTIITRDGRELPVSVVILHRDSCLFTDATGRASMPTADVVAVRNVDRLSSAVGGFGIGLVSGFAVGMGAAYLVTDREDADSRMGAGLLALSITAAGSLIGLGIGAAHGTITEYRLPAAIPDSTARSTDR